MDDLRCSPSSFDDAMYDDSILVPLPSRNLPKIPQSNENKQEEWLQNVSDRKSKEVEALLSTNILAHAKYQLNHLELQCHVQPTYEELTTTEPLFIRNQAYQNRKLRAAVSSDKTTVPDNGKKDTSSRISISALVSEEETPEEKPEAKKKILNPQETTNNSHSFDVSSFLRRKSLAATKILPLKRIRIDPSDFTYQQPVGNSTSTCEFHIDVHGDNYIYNDQYLYISQEHELLSRENKRPRVYKIEYGAAPIRPEKLSNNTLSRWNVVKSDIYRQFRSHLQVRSQLVGLAKRTAINCQKEVKKKVLKSVRQGKDAGNRGKKLSREVMTYWRKHDKEQRGAVRRAQKAASQLRKRDDEIREAQRQQKKLNFLLTQTELYAHFIGKKTGVDESSDGPTVASGQSIAPPQIEDAEIAAEAAKATEAAIEATRARMEAFDEETRARKKKLGIKVRQAASYSEAKNSRPAMPSLEENSSGTNNPSSLIENPNIEEHHKISQPSIFAGKLKNYQLKGLNWLVNLYDQGINGILADDMGLGKTIQTIAFLGHLAEEKDIWGPFLVIAPVSTLHNWLQEIARFTPALKALPYWGAANDRKIIRRFWTPKHMYTREASMHVVVTSYQLIVQDEKYFRRVKWQYMVLDEAHALKSTASVRWKTLLSFHCRNRLLLTGTPIQNNMAELWALLHFIMPSFFDSHEEFNDWFSKDIENHAEGSGKINEQQLSRLHTILKPFMLRRVKNDIADEMVKKYEKEQRCHLTERQKRLYRGIKANISISDLLSQSTKADNSAHLMNLVMQFRKVCNHPELFERRGVTSPFQFINPSESISDNPICRPIPKFLYRTDCSAEGYDIKRRQLSPSLLKLFNIYSPKHMEESLDPFSWCNKHRNSQMSDDSNNLFIDSPFSFLRGCNLSIAEGSRLIQSELLEQNHDHCIKQEEYLRKIISRDFPSELEESPFLIRPVFQLRRDLSSPLWNVSSYNHNNRPDIIRNTRTYSPAAAATPILPFIPDRSYLYDIHEFLFNGKRQQFLYGKDFQCSVENASNAWKPFPSYSPIFPEKGLLTPLFNIITATRIFVPDFTSVINDSGKLKELDRLLSTLKAEGHCVLVYSQMTKMLDLLEEYMNYRKYTYHRLDGTSKLSERRDMVSDFQNNGVFVFLLSTRAGGLGINLTAADTVIFYDSDWNPTMDDQAMDRAHRLGQTRPVTVYRLVTVDSIEERILARAKEKQNIQSIVIAGGKFEAGAFNSTEVVSLLLNDSEVEPSIMKTVQDNHTKRAKKKKTR